MAVFGSARIAENGTVNGKAGDQKQTSTPDFKGEVARETFYDSKKGWYILRPKKAEHAAGIADAMERACDNVNIGYSQYGDPNRYGIVREGTRTTKPTNGDCSSTVRQCVKEGTGKDPGDFTTGNEVEKLMATGLFDKYEYVSGMALVRGDIAATKSKGHTGVITEGDKKKSVKEIAQEVIDGKWGSGQDRKNRIHAAGYDYAEVQAEVNRMLEKAAEHIGEKGLALIKHYEGCKLRAYKLPGEQYYTIGWGHHGKDVDPDMHITQSQADKMFRDDLVKFENYVKANVTDIVLTQNRLDALVSYTYNRGVKGIKQLAENCHTVSQYAEGIVKYWGSAERYKTALVNRRKKEQELFLS